MSIVCSQCGYENSERYRFCGRCGSLLPAVKADAPKAAPVTAAPTPPPVSAPPTQEVSGPSFLGLSHEPSRSVEYLLEDDEPHDGGRRRMYAALLLLIIAGIVVLWHWRGSLVHLADLNGSQTAGAPPPSNPSSLTPGPPVGNVAATAPAPSMPMGSTQAPTNAQSNTPPPASEEARMVNPDASKEQPGAANSKEQPEAPKQAEPAKTEPSQTANDSTDKESGNEEAATPPPMEKKPSPAPVAKTTPKAEPPAPEPAVSADDKLVADGEKYLYGTGAPENCSLAEKNLRAAAAHQNSKALSMLGAMYATGHCTSRDLTMAYRFFARALHQDPSNGRIQRDLEVLWRQMSASERQAATRSQ